LRRAVVEKQVPPPEAPVPKRPSNARSRSTAVAVPPGKKNGWEHQDLRRRHLLVSEKTKNVPRTPLERRGKAVRRAFDPGTAISSVVSSSFLGPGSVRRACDDSGVGANRFATISIDGSV
jgi:hypothetical protein